MENNLTALAFFLRTKPNAYRFLEKIDGLLLELGQRPEIYIQNNFTSEEIMHLPMRDQLTTNNISQIYTQVKSIPIIVVTTAIKPSIRVEESIVRSLQNTLPEAFLIEWHENSALIGGAIIEYKGKRYDNSLKNKLQKS